MRRHTTFFREHQAFENRVASSDFLNKLGVAGVKYFAPGNLEAYDGSVDEVYQADPQAHLVLLDDYRILDVNRTLELQVKKG